MPDEAYTDAISQDIELLQTLGESRAPVAPITVDPELDPTSENPVENRAIAEEFETINQRLEEIEPRKLASATALNDGGIIRYNTGAINIGSSASSYSNAIDISGCAQIVYTRPILATASAPSSGMAFYSDAAGTQLVGSMIRNGNDASATASRAELYTATVPEGAVTARFTYFISHIDGSPNTVYYKYPFAVYDKAEFGAAYSASVVGRMDALEQELDERAVPESTAADAGKVLKVGATGSPEWGEGGGSTEQSYTISLDDVWHTEDTAGTFNRITYLATGLSADDATMLREKKISRVTMDIGGTERDVIADDMTDQYGSVSGWDAIEEIRLLAPRFPFDSEGDLAVATILFDKGSKLFTQFSQDILHDATHIKIYWEE